MARRVLQKSLDREARRSAGAKAAAAGLSVREQGLGGGVHKTILTLSSVSVAITSTGSANGFGGIKLYDFPAGQIRLRGAQFSGSISVPTADQADFTDATPEGDIGIGSAIVADADALGTDATDDDMATAAAFTMAAYADSDVVCKSEEALTFDGTGTALDANLNVLVDAADIDDDASTTVEVSGTVTLLWENIGDV